MYSLWYDHGFLVTIQNIFLDLWIVATTIISIYVVVWCMFCFKCGLPIQVEYLRLNMFVNLNHATHKVFCLKV